MAVVNETVYIKADQNVEVTKPDVSLGDILSMECSNKDVVPRLKSLKILKIPKQGTRRYVISILRIVQLIHEVYPGIDVQSVGEPDIIVTFEDQKTPNKWLHWLKTIGVVIITFIGAAFSIMAFNNDVSTAGLFSQIYELLVGKPSDGFTILEVTYSIGLSIGILIFFNHFGGKKFTVDPTPMEIELRLYENDIQTTLVQNYSRKEQEIDVDTTNPACNHRP
ncbi:stage V sporulation protein AA [Lachnospiraceae bacterium LCP25S3_G4]